MRYYPTHLSLFKCAKLYQLLYCTCTVSCERPCFQRRCTGTHLDWKSGVSAWNNQLPTCNGLQHLSALFFLFLYVLMNSSHLSLASWRFPFSRLRRRWSNRAGPTCQDKQMVPRFSLLDDVLSLLVGALIHTLHHVFDLLQLQPLQVLVLVQGICQQLFYTVHRQQKRKSDFCCENKGGFECCWTRWLLYMMALDKLHVVCHIFLLQIWEKLL